MMFGHQLAPMRCSIKRADIEPLYVQSELAAPYQGALSVFKLPRRHNQSEGRAASR